MRQRVRGDRRRGRSSSRRRRARCRSPPRSTRSRPRTARRSRRRAASSPSAARPHPRPCSSSTPRRSRSRTRGRCRRSSAPPLPPIRAIPSPARCASRVELMGEQRRVGREHDDDRAGAGARDGFLFVPRGRDHRAGELEADGDAVDREALAVAVVGLHERADAPAARRRRDAVPVPPLNSWQIMPVPPPTPPSATGPPDAFGQRVVHVRRRHVHPVDVVQRAVVGLGDDRQRPERASCVALRPCLRRRARRARCRRCACW